MKAKPKRMKPVTKWAAVNRVTGVVGEVSDYRCALTVFPAERVTRVRVTELPTKKKAKEGR